MICNYCANQETCSSIWEIVYLFIYLFFLSFEICEVTAINLIPICLLAKALLRLITYTSIHKRDKVLGVPDGFKSFFNTPCMTINSGELQKPFKIILFCSVTIKRNCACLSYCVAISMKLKSLLR